MEGKAGRPNFGRRTDDREKGKEGKKGRRFRFFLFSLFPLFPIASSLHPAKASYYCEGR